MAALVPRTEHFVDSRAYFAGSDGLPLETLQEGSEGHERIF